MANTRKAGVHQDKVGLGKHANVELNMMKRGRTHRATSLIFSGTHLTTLTTCSFIAPRCRLWENHCDSQPPCRVYLFSFSQLCQSKYFRPLSWHRMPQCWREMVHCGEPKRTVAGVYWARNSPAIQVTGRDIAVECRQRVGRECITRNETGDRQRAWTK